MKRAYLALGSNLGEREENLREALRRLECEKLCVARVSSIYETEPMYVADQPWFLNLVAEVDTDFFPMQLLSRIGRVEQEMGRRRVQPNGPRTIDIDILLYGAFVVSTPKLAIPHPRMTERRFVLEPMVELVPELRHPVLKKSMRELLAAMQGSEGSPLRRSLTPPGSRVLPDLDSGMDAAEQRGRDLRA